jgi:hypothetical protein
MALHGMHQNKFILSSLLWFCNTKEKPIKIDEDRHVKLKGKGFLPGL